MNGSIRDHILASTRFIAIEGIDCAGKGSLLEVLVPHIRDRVAYHCEKLQADPFPVDVFTPWEGDTWGSKVREVFVSGVGDPDVELMLAFAARRSLVLNRLKPLLAEGGFAVVDRYVASSFAYQVETATSAYLWADLLRLTCEQTVPGLTIYLDVPAEVSQHRLRVRNAIKDGFEVRGAEFFEAVRSRYGMAFSLLKTAAPNSLYAYVDANDRPEAVFSKARDVVNSYIDRMFSIDQDVIARATAFLDSVSVDFPIKVTMPTRA